MSEPMTSGVRGADVGAPADDEVPAGPGHSSTARRLLLAVAAGVVLLGVAVVVALATGAGGRRSPARIPSRATRPPIARVAPKAVSVAELSGAAAAVGHPVYWAGPSRVDTYELTENGDGNVFVRYLNPGVAAGDPQAAYLTVGSYPVDDGLAIIRQAAAKPGAKMLTAPQGALAVTRTDHPTSAYVSFPGAKVLIEVFTPSIKRTRALVAMGRIRPVP